MRHHPIRPPGSAEVAVFAPERPQRIPRFPLILFGKKHWQGLLDWLAGTLGKGHFISPGDMELITLTDDPEEAIGIILDYERRVGLPE